MFYLPMNSTKCDEERKTFFKKKIFRQSVSGPRTDNFPFLQADRSIFDLRFCSWLSTNKHSLAKSCKPATD